MVDHRTVLFIYLLQVSRVPFAFRYYMTHCNLTCLIHSGFTFYLRDQILLFETSCLVVTKLENAFRAWDVIASRSLDGLSDCQREGFKSGLGSICSEPVVPDCGE